MSMRSIVYLRYIANILYIMLIYFIKIVKIQITLYNYNVIELYLNIKYTIISG